MQYKIILIFEIVRERLKFPSPIGVKSKNFSIKLMSNITLKLHESGGKRHFYISLEKKIKKNRLKSSINNKNIL